MIRSSISRFRRFVERIIGGAHVGELGVAALARHDPSGQQRIFRRNRPERCVGVPEPVAERAQADAVVGLAHLVVAVEVRDVGHLQLQPAILGLAHLAAGGDFQFAEAAAEGQLGVVVKALVVEDQHSEAVHAGLDRGDVGVGQLAGQVDAADVAGEVAARRYA